MIKEFIKDQRKADEAAEDAARGRAQAANADLAAAFQLRVGDVGYLAPCALTDEQLGSLKLMKIMPDTWNNVPWTVASGMDTIKEACLEHRRLIEQVKEYTMSTCQKVIKSQVEFIQEYMEAAKLLKGDIVHSEAMVVREIKKAEEQLQKDDNYIKEKIEKMQ